MKQQQHTCTTSFLFQFDFDCQKNIELLRHKRECSPEQIGILNKDEVEHAIIEVLGVKPIWNRHSFEMGRNDEYSVYVSDMIRVTLKDLFGKEKQIVELKEKYKLTTVLSIVPYIDSNSDLPKQCLSLDNDIIEFLHNTGTKMDLDYYIV